MPRIAQELGPLDVKRLTHTGGKTNDMVAVGGVPGLYLQVTRKGGKTWVLRATVGAMRRDIGLGGFPAVTLSQAREKARDARDKIERGIDPVAERKAVKAALALAQSRGLSFADAVDKCLAAKLDAFRNPKHRQQWRNTLDGYATPELGKMMVQDIATQDVLRVLQPLWTDKTETASRLRGRIEAVLSWATVAGHRTGDNPARWAGNLKELLPAASKVAKEGNHPALAIDDAPRWYAALQGRDGTGARALQLLVLTATRSQEVRGAAWDEIDMDKGLWVIPAQRMKMDREHRVPLSAAAVALLQNLPRHDGNPLVFPSARGGQVSDMTLSATMKRMHEAEVAADRAGFVDRVSKRPAVPHGLRSTFRDWVAERTQYPGDMAEVALAHRISNAVEASYRRGDMIEKRRAMMAAWAGFLGQQEPAGKVVRLQK
ncbi:MAG: integrase arm-type DNA-binding domain-containing protein [Rhodobacter sp.]|nr:integrase arm-type DNA-binding domain-containing protein [Rhodobacter sp.]MCA3512167.1 integrase arm-type DNA-binding domain-containing protein [Rhodobacter sp.]MCA3519600.1 integrase arm-type DNA-binding domain-containing protein [Rhodobacter sp.]MCA3524305.1 integrase arm-type DNA-binding domain-containing protein [Rhodobacter sp.]MCA3527293.1 integrase arm-type DNA-binding domain-containing protein [Rhodobacter sp.]